MAESVDALVSNTSGATHPGSSPGLGTLGSESAMCCESTDLQHIFRLAGLTKTKLQK